MNPWGIASGPTSPACGSRTITATPRRSTTATAISSPLVVHFRLAPAAASFDATGIVFNATYGLRRERRDARAAPAVFIFAGEGGSDRRLVAERGCRERGHAVHGARTARSTKASRSRTTARATSSTPPTSQTARSTCSTAASRSSVAASFAFSDSTLPAGYAPFGIQAITSGGATRIYVALREARRGRSRRRGAGAGLGVVNVFDTNGISSSTWSRGRQAERAVGLGARAADFGTLSNALLVGNFGDGKIHGSTPASGRYSASSGRQRHAVRGRASGASRSATTP